MPYRIEPVRYAESAMRHVPAAGRAPRRDAGSRIYATIYRCCRPSADVDLVWQPAGVFEFELAAGDGSVGGDHPAKSAHDRSEGWPHGSAGDRGGGH